MTRALTLGVGVFLAAAALLGAAPARAHLIPARQGTVNVVGDSVFAVLSVPISSLHGADDDGDGVLDAGELSRHEATLRAEIDRRFAILDGATTAATVRIDMILSPQHDAVGDRADQIVVLKHVRFESPPRDLRVRCDLFGTRDSERELTLTATRHPASGTETQKAALLPDAEEALFFSPPPAPETGGLARAIGAPRGPLSLVVLSAIGLALVWTSRSRRRPTAPHAQRML